MNQRRPVLAIHTATLPPLGADTWVHLQILRCLDRHSIVPFVACSTGGPDTPTPTFAALSQIPDLQVVPVDLGPELYERRGFAKLRGLLQTLPAIPSIVRLALLVRRERIGIIHTSDRPRDAFAAVLLGRLTGASSIIHVHVVYNSWMGRLLRWSLAHANRVVAVSEFVAESLVRAGIPAARVHVVLNAIELAEWVPGEGRVEARSELGVHGDTPLILTVSRLFPEKGTADLIRALHIAHREVPDAQLVVVGADVSASGAFLDELECLVDDLGLGESVRFLGRRNDVPRLMAAADLYAMPSFEEPFGLVFLEAMAMELPVVALSNGGTLEVVEHDRTGLLSAPGDVEALGRHIVRLLRDRPLRAEMGARGRQRVEDHFTTVRQAGDVTDIYSLTSR
jgi:glycosyltransferase involved in cell wall biosynthesis